MFKVYDNHVLMLNSAEAGARGVDGSLYFPLPSINRIGLIKSSLLFAILLFWAVDRIQNEMCPFITGNYFFVGTVSEFS